MGFQWRQNTGLGLTSTEPVLHDDDERYRANGASNFSVPSFSRLLRKDQIEQASPRRHSSVDESLYGSRPESLQHIARRPASIHSPQLGQGDWDGNVFEAVSATDFLPRDLDQYPHGETPRVATFPQEQIAPTPAVLSPLPPLPLFSFPSSSTTTPMKSRPKVDRSATSYHTAHYSVSEYDEDEENTLEPINQYPTPVSNRSSPAKPHPLRASGGGHSSQRSSPTKSLRQSQAKAREANPSYFAWRKSVEQSRARTGNFDDNGGLISPASSSAGAVAASQGQPPARLGPISMDYPSDSDDEPLFSGSVSQTTGTSPDGNQHIEELMDELRGVSAELAASIRREMDLEDELERFRTEPQMPAASRRTSDYFSESGTSSMKLPTADSQSKIESLETMRRKVEQEKAKLRLAMAEKAEADMIQRRALEMHVHSLEEQLSRGDVSHARGVQSREEELELALDEVRNHLNEERQMKQEVEQLLNRLQHDHEACLDERDNLKDETVPQLRARLEGLESESTGLQKLQYENTQLQQELQMMRSENQTLVEARRLQVEQSQRFKSFADDGDAFTTGSPMASPRIGMQRSQSIARSRSLKRPGSVLNSPNPSSMPPLPSDSIKDVEDQRDALHISLRTLLLRQDVLNRQHSKQLQILRAERDEALRQVPSSSSLKQDVQRLRNDFSTLRQRADEASEQKWQCEKGLSGLRMDLERTQEETTSMKRISRSDGARSINAAVSRSGAEQQAAAKQIIAIEVSLRAAEDRLTAAQNQCEEALLQEESHVRTLEEADLEKARRNIARMVVSKRATTVLGSKRRHALNNLRKGQSSSGTNGSSKEFEELRDAVRILEDAVSQSEQDIQALMARLNGLHEEMGALVA